MKASASDNQLAIEQWTVLLSVSVYLVSFITTVTNFYPGVVAFVVLFGSVLWLPNPLYYLAICFFGKRPLLSFVLAMAAGLLSLLPAIVHGGTSGLRIGYFLWVGSFLILINGAGLSLWYSNRS